MPLHMRLPKLKGFKNRNRVEFQVVNLARLAELFPKGGTIGVDELVEAGAVRKGEPVKVLGDGRARRSEAAGHGAHVQRVGPGEARSGGRLRHVLGGSAVTDTRTVASTGALLVGATRCWIGTYHLKSLRIAGA